MARLFLLALFVLLVAGVTLAIRSCDRHASETEQSAAKVDPKAADAVIGLPDGATLIAAKGSIGRRLIDWLSSSEGSSETFEVGGREFPKGSAAPTPEGAGRIPRLVAILHGYPDVDILVVGHAEPSGDAVADATLSRARAQYVVGELRKAGIAENRLSLRGAGSLEPLPADSPLRSEGASNDRVSLKLTRRKESS